MITIYKFDKKKHNRKNFDCENEQLNKYLKQQASQDIKKDLAACFVILDEENDDIIGYYTLSSASIPREDLPSEHSKKIPSNYNAPVILLGRLAIDKSHKGKGLGTLLLVDSMKRCLKALDYVASMAIVTDPIDDDAEKFYLKYGFKKLPTSKRLFITMSTVEKSF